MRPASPPAHPLGRASPRTLHCFWRPAPPPGLLPPRRFPAHSPQLQLRSAVQLLTRVYVPCAADGELAPAEISALSRAGYGRTDDGRFFADEEKLSGPAKAAEAPKPNNESVRLSRRFSSVKQLLLICAAVVPSAEAVGGFGVAAGRVRLGADPIADRGPPRPGRDAHAGQPEGLQQAVARLLRRS